MTSMGDRHHDHRNKEKLSTCVVKREHTMWYRSSSLFVERKISDCTDTLPWSAYCLNSWLWTYPESIICTRSNCCIETTVTKRTNRLLRLISSRYKTIYQSLKHRQNHRSRQRTFTCRFRDWSEKCLTYMSVVRWIGRWACRVSDSWVVWTEKIIKWWLIL